MSTRIVGTRVAPHEPSAGSPSPWSARTARPAVRRAAARAANWLIVVLAAFVASWSLEGPAAAATPGAPAPPGAPASARPATPAASPGPTALPGGLTAGSWLVADADTGKILAAKDARKRDLPASTIKILTALVVLPGLSPDLRVTVGDDAARVDGSKVGLVPGQSYTVRDLATAMLIASGNDATTALVDASGGAEAVVARMNALAAVLGATDTHAVDPTGLDAPGQRTSVRDLAVLGRAALDEPSVSQYLTIPRTRLPGRDGGTFEIQNHNLLLGNYEGTLGVKNGYTIAADATYAGAVRRDGHTLLVALLRAAPNYGIDARKLFDWGFANVSAAAAIGELPAAVSGTDLRRALAGDGAARLALAGPGTVHALGGGGARPAAAGGHHDGGIGWFTWTALGVTGVAALLTLLADQRRLRASRPRATRNRTDRRGRRRPRPSGPLSSGPAWDPARSLPHQRAARDYHRLTWPPGRGSGRKD